MRHGVALAAAEISQMGDMPALDAASKRLASALDALEAAVERRREADRGEQSLQAQLHALGSDRAQLAADLDGAVARSREIEATNREIARRIDVAIDGIRSVLETNDR
jgi:septal ring factor EnvC (AmiA/AmiB activator)